MGIFWFIWFLVAIAGAFIAFAVGKGEAVGQRSGPYGVAALLFVLALFPGFTFSFLFHVSTKNEAVLTTFGAPSGKAQDGLHMKWPWEVPHEMDAAIQTDNHVVFCERNRDCVPAEKQCINVRIANQQTACVPVSVRWRIVREQAPELFKDYRTFEHVRDSLVTRYLTAAVNNQLRDYNPLNSIGLSSPAGGQNNASLATIASRITKQMQMQVGSQIQVLNTLIPIIHFDDATQKRVNQLQQQIALTRIAEQEIITNEKKATANKKLASSISNAPNVLVSNCLDILSTMVKAGQTVPPGFSCWPGGNLAGIIAGAK